MSDAGDDRTGALLPVERRVTLRCGRAQAFAAFVTGVGRWWPAGFSASVERLADVVIETRPGGRVFERDRDGGEFDWGTVRAYEPERRVVLAWTLAVGGDGATEVELAFADAGDGGAALVYDRSGGGDDDDNGSAADRANRTVRPPVICGGVVSKRRARGRARHRPMSCPTADELAGLADPQASRLSPRQLVALQDHVAGCDSCRLLLRERLRVGGG